MWQTQVLLGSNLEHDQITPACTSFCHVSTLSAAKTGLNRVKFLLHVHLLSGVIILSYDFLENAAAPTLTT